MEFCREIYKEQLKAGRHFLHEHPWSAKSWWLRCVKEIMRDPRAILVKTDLCRFGMQTTDEAGKLGPARKRTGFLTSSWALAEELTGTCEGQHRHNHLVERRAKGSEIYPPELCRAIARGAARQKLADEANVRTSRPMTMSSLMSVLSKDVKEDWTDEVHEEDGGDDLAGVNKQKGIDIMKESMKDIEQDIYEGEAWDDVTGMELRAKMVQEAKQEDSSALLSIGLWTAKSPYYDGFGDLHAVFSAQQKELSKKGFSGETSPLLSPRRSPSPHYSRSSSSSSSPVLPP